LGPEGPDGPEAPGCPVEPVDPLGPLGPENPFGPDGPDAPIQINSMIAFCVDKFQELLLLITSHTTHTHTRTQLIL